METPYGAWPSPIDARLAAVNDGRPEWVHVAGHELWWCEPRPAEDGRIALVRRRGDGPAETVLPPPWNVRSRMHEYGGDPWVLLPDGTVLFVEFSDQRVYALRDGSPVPLTPVPEVPSGLRYAEMQPAPGGDEVWCVRERHRSEASTDVERALVAIPLDGSAVDDPEAVRVLVTDRHFLTCPRISPDGRRLAWIGWDHPHMPWDSTELRVADLDPADGVKPAFTVAGGPDEAVVQCEWLDPDTLVAVTDPEGWWNVRRIDVTGGAAVDLCPREEEFGGPLWKVGARWFSVLDDGRIVALHGVGHQRPSVLDPETGELSPLETPYDEWTAQLATDGDRLVGVAGTPDQPWQLVEIDVASGRFRAMPREGTVELPPDYVPRAERRTFRGVGGREVHAVVYPPRHPDHTVDGMPPPYVVFVHGGPTSRYPPVLDGEVAFFTSRGLGVVEVDYGGTTGYGREYRNRLRRHWGIVDVEDCVAVAKGLVAEGLADPQRLAIRGGSAGGFTSAGALTACDTFACATIRYPILDLAGWRATDTHDFESRYVESLVGTWPEEAHRYEAQSPLSRVEKLSKPFLLLQGLEDVICPPAQSERLLEAVAGRGVPHAYLTFEGEQHGFRKVETLVAALEAELSLYGQVFGFDPGVPRLELRT